MNQHGFSFVEVLLSIFILSLILGLSYQLFLTLEEVHRENQVYQHLLSEMEREIEEWRHQVDKEDKTLMVNGVSISEEVYVYPQEPFIEQADFTFRWQTDRKEHRFVWHVNRFRSDEPGD